ncbi:GerAB/ArcD/ProY family transporter [Peribacillus alkalitolerans]|uniref:GerAB/ArcD/ProY family transporter n=1 Tax=Peribacillus alkalitolerans TaxID=1550385 RepID=UPI0013D15E8A|nr:GerAB/ArcD/ProY family transporter [Peribacillus alkalitolerans]
MVNKSDQVSPFLVFFLISKVQVGVGVLGFQRIIIQDAGNDAWIAVIVAGIFFSMAIWLMYKLLDQENKDIVGIHQNIFGKWFGGLISMIWIVYWLATGISIFRAYIEVVQAWVFPQINVLTFSVILALLVYYTISGGFRTVTGICFLGVVIPAYLILTFIFPLEFTAFRNLLPIWNHSIKEISLASKDMTYSYLGISTLLMYYPLIKHAKTSQKWAHLGNFLTMSLYLIVIIITIAYYSEAQVSKYIWATLSIWKIVEMPFVERFEYIGITSWVLVILPNICLTVWAASKGTSRIFNLKEKKVSIALLVVLVTVSYLLNGRHAINLFIDWMSKVGYYLLFAYLPLLVIVSTLKSKLRKKSQ